MIDLQDIPRDRAIHVTKAGISKLIRPSLIAILEDKQDEAAKRKNRFIRLLTKETIAGLEDEEKGYPALSAVAKRCNIPYSTVRLWECQDQDFAKILQDIEDFWIDNCKKVVYDASRGKGGAWLALELLKKKRKEEFGETPIQAHYTQINLDSNVRKPLDAIRAIETAVQAISEDPAQDSPNDNVERLDGI